MSQETRSGAQNVNPAASLLGKVAVTGFVGGIFWSIIGIFSYYFNFAEVGPKTFILRSWLKTEWTDGWLGEIVSIFICGFLSIAMAFIYYILLKKWYSMWGGVLFGIVCWIFIFIMFHPVYPSIPPVQEMKLETIISTLSIFVIYGVFIGYSIAYDYYDAHIKEMQLTQKKQNNKKSQG
ncbi:YqhR family membrane protein [Virgibacillus halophilus]|uniref:YqhR family membrane protein n=1 Tax=Tigheibacillus halophilus TaxID=361280 RepID=UPI00363412CF